MKNLFVSLMLLLTGFTYVNGLLDQTIRFTTPVTGYVCSKGKLYKRALNQEEVKGL